MKGKITVFILSVLFLSLGIILLTRKDAKFQIISLPSIYSSYQTEDAESIYVKFLTNDVESYYFHKDLITNVTMKNNDKMIDMNIKDIHFITNEYIFKEINYNYVTFELELNVVPEDTEIVMDNCILELQYENGEVIELSIGSYYLLNRENSHDLSLDNLFALHAEIDQVDTITGIYIELYNKTESNILIKRIETPGSIYFDNYMFKDVERELLHYEDVASVLLLEEYSHFKNHADYDQGHVLLSGQSDNYFVPLLYNGDVPFIYRLPIKVVYEVNGIEKVYIIDDFPYINTPFFKEELEEYFVVYERD